MKVAVIGAGVAGLSAAYCLSKSKTTVDVYESSSKLGGLSQTITLWNQKVDIGPHRFFSTDRRVNSLWLEVVKDDYNIVDRLTRIYYKKNFYNYPLSLSNTLKNLGIWEAGHCLLSYLKQKIFPTKQDGSFEKWIENKFGRRLFEVFFKTYTEKLWGIPCTDLDADFAAQRIKKLSVYEAIKNILLQGKRNKHVTLIDQFAYPLEGTGMVYERMAEFIEKSGNNIFLNSPVASILTENSRVIGVKLEDGSTKMYDHVISTMPYTLMVKTLNGVPVELVERSKKLTFRNTIIIYLQIDSTELFPDNWIYVHSSELKMGRITNFRNWLPSLYGQERKTILAIEYWCNSEDSMWNDEDSELIALASKEIVKTGLVDISIIDEGFVYRIPKSYPVYNKGYKEILRPINEYLCSLTGLHVIGRYGAFKYNNQDHSILMGILAAENIADGTKHKLYDINSDYHTYQESYVITKTGLVKK
jgi:protoporphyrinogen oxidase